MKTVVCRVRGWLQPFIVGIAQRCGSDIVDYRTGRVIGRALLVAFRGKVHVIGLREPVLPVFAPQERMTYWKQEIVFTAHPPPDFSHDPGA